MGSSGHGVRGGGGERGRQKSGIGYKGKRRKNITSLIKEQGGRGTDGAGAGLAGEGAWGQAGGRALIAAEGG